MKASKANKIINNSLKGVFMRSAIKANGWTELQARSYLVEFVTSGAKLSLREFMELKS